MKDYVLVERFEDEMTVCFYIEREEVMAVAEEMENINPDAYMNGYNWEMFFDYYLGKYHPDLLEGLDADPEAGMYSASYEWSEENEVRAKQFGELICKLIEEKEELYRILREEGDEIEWD